jgi:DNA helicase-2/ATP-dependent DNA helicase PcrA
MKLNSEQARAVETIDGPVLVLSGAGTGKTRLLVERAASLIKSRRAKSAQVLNITFTTKAAGELRTRLVERLGVEDRALSAGTFHSIAFSLLRDRPAVAGLRSGFEVADDRAVRRLLQQLVDDRHKEVVARFPSLVEEDGELPDDLPAALAGVLSRFKSRGLEPSRLTLGRDPDDLERAAAWIYQAYQDALAAENLADFGDLLLWPTMAMEADENLRRRWARRWRYLQVDEFQDTNPIQLRFLKMLSAGHQNICCVGDDDQAIHGWAGAEVTCILDFERHFPAAAVIRLETNYRSTPTILEAANALIAGNATRRGKTLRPGRSGTGAGAKIRVVETPHPQVEAQWVAAQIAAANPQEPGAVFVLYRAHWQSRLVEDALLERGIPYRIASGRSFYERAVVRDGIAYLRLLGDGEDAEALERISARPPRGLGSASLRRIAEAGGLGEAASADLPRSAQEGVAQLVAALAEARAVEGDTAAHLEALLEASGYLRWRWEQEEDEDWRADLDELMRALGDAGSPEALIGRADSAGQTDDEGAPVVLMTLHASKGLEAPRVFAVNWAAGLFPSEQAELEGGEAIAAERRLAYVGLTRAREELTVTWSREPGLFVGELPPTLVAGIRLVRRGGRLREERS